MMRRREGLGRRFSLLSSALRCFSKLCGKGTCVRGVRVSHDFFFVRALTHRMHGHGGRAGAHTLSLTHRRDMGWTYLSDASGDVDGIFPSLN
jgi:hypothetical protein